VSAFTSANIEKILALQPHLFLTFSDLHADTRRRSHSPRDRRARMDERTKRLHECNYPPGLLRWKTEIEFIRSFQKLTIYEGIKGNPCVALNTTTTAP
jgi:hypothetical protein